MACPLLAAEPLRCQKPKTRNAGILGLSKISNQPRTDSREMSVATSSMAGTLSVPSLLILLLLFLVQPSQPANNIVMDGLVELKGTTIHVGDSLVFKHKYHLQNLYLFCNRRAFDLCSFSHATLIYDGSKSTNFIWHPARPGYYYFSTRDSSKRSCEEGQKLPVRVVNPDPSPGLAPPPTAGGDFPSRVWAISSPSSTPTPAPEAASSSSDPLEPSNGHAPSPASRDGGLPFISTDPAVPLPTGGTDSATIRPLPSPGDDNQVVGQGSLLRVGAALLVFVMMPSFGLVVESHFLSWASA